MQMGWRRDPRTPSLPHAVGNVPPGSAASSHPYGMRSVLSSRNGGKKFPLQSTAELLKPPEKDCNHNKGLKMHPNQPMY